ncbi:MULTISPECIES: hypothetical protein [unclassified Sinorhizobium]|uniref:hypothetical protein n=1 Tax=unclassified Sinorhizobium TaxID=2613772 RepID=UPI0024C40A68|nr:MULTISPECIES: hypothetical protein [unclassified Sinorhizobium]MDK1376772.1 hypothetical protein [Sinorhizobium sp. 6-70]MDK1479544.1 hypothetical protein [Sinorhizobium sp. 6-117]
MTSPGDFFNQETGPALLVGSFVGLLVYFALSRLIGAGRPTRARTTAERQFRNVYSIMDEGRRQSLIRYYMEKYECGRDEVMRRAVEERSRR